MKTTETAAEPSDQTSEEQEPDFFAHLACSFLGNGVILWLIGSLWSVLGLSSGHTSMWSTVGLSLVSLGGVVGVAVVIVTSLFRDAEER